jgi:dihydropteroate synthase
VVPRSSIDHLNCAGKRLLLNRPLVMGVLNVTPDSFSDGGQYLAPERALARARAMVAEGADLIDVGGESTRPGAVPVSVQDELARVIPLVERLVRELPVPISVDTSKPAVMTAAIAAGAGLINDVCALREVGALAAVASQPVVACLMHMQGLPTTMQHDPRYGDVLVEVKSFLAERIRACEAAGIARERLIVDPGFGFGKTLEHNLQLLRRLGELHELGVPRLVGLSRKSMIGKLLDDAPVGERLYGSLAAAVIAAWQGASIVRVHDVKATVQALRVCEAVSTAGQRG